VGHSLSAWAIEGYLAGLSLSELGELKADSRLAQEHRQQIRGVITVAGVYSLWWRKPLRDAARAPLRSAADFYGSNYELELLSGIDALYHVVPRMRSLPLNWIDDILSLPVQRIPWIGSRLEALYRGFQHRLARTPLFSMFYYPGNTSPEMIEHHVRDGMEDLGPRLLEQLANAIQMGKTTTHFHLTPPPQTYEYGSVRREELSLPLLFVGGGRDRLASIDQIYRDGYLEAQTRNKEFLGVEEAGHLDIVTGSRAREEVWMPVVDWLRRNGG
jgi:hypothetical protein